MGHTSVALTEVEMQLKRRQSPPLAQPTGARNMRIAEPLPPPLFYFLIPPTEKPLKNLRLRLDLRFELNENRGMPFASWLSSPLRHETERVIIDLRLAKRFLEGVARDLGFLKEPAYPEVSASLLARDPLGRRPEEVSAEHLAAYRARAQDLAARAAKRAEWELASQNQGAQLAQETIATYFNESPPPLHLRDAWFLSLPFARAFGIAAVPLRAQARDLVILIPREDEATALFAHGLLGFLKACVGGAHGQVQRSTGQLKVILEAP